MRLIVVIDGPLRIRLIPETESVPEGWWEMGSVTEARFEGFSEVDKNLILSAEGYEPDALIKKLLH